MPSTAKKPLQMSKPKPAPAEATSAEKRIIAQAENTEESKAPKPLLCATYLLPETVARIDAVRGAGSEIGMSRSVWIRHVVLKALDEAGKKA